MVCANEDAEPRVISNTSHNHQHGRIGRNDATACRVGSRFGTGISNVRETRQIAARHDQRAGCHPKQLHRAGRNNIYTAAEDEEKEIC